MKLAITVTCLLIEAEEKGIKFALQADGKLRVTIPNPSPNDLIDRLKGHKDDIVEQLRYDKFNPCPFVEFFDKLCLFCPCDRIVASEGEILEAYRLWTEENQQQYQPHKLKQRLKELGCLNTGIQGESRWEHILIWGVEIPLNKHHVPWKAPQYLKTEQNELILNTQRM